MSDFYQQILLNSGYLPGRALVQARGSIGGHRYVFVKLQMSGKDALVFPTSGGIVKNPFKGNARAFAGTLAEYIPSNGSNGSEIRILKSYAVAKDAAEHATDIYLKRGGYSLIPFVGDTLMVAPPALTEKGPAATITAVEKATDETAGDVWKVTLNGPITGPLTTSSVLVEAKETGPGKEAMVTNPNSYLPCDFDFVFDPAASNDVFDGARYLITPVLALGDVFLYEDRMQPLSDALKALNKSKVKGWFNI